MAKSANDKLGKKDTAPSVNGANGAEGRDSSGRFTKGNGGGPGNPHVKQTALVRSALLSAVTVEDVGAIVKALVAQAKNGDVTAAKEIFDRCLGKSRQAIDVGFGDAQQNIEGMDDLELARTIVHGGMIDQMPPFLRRKMELCYKEEWEQLKFEGAALPVTPTPGSEIEKPARKPRKKKPRSKDRGQQVAAKRKAAKKKKS